MGVDLVFIKMNDDSYRSYSGAREDALKMLCQLVGLPTLPYRNGISYEPVYHLASKGYIVKKEEKRWINYSDYIYIPHEKSIKRARNLEYRLKIYKSYLNWLEWGVKKLESLTVEDMQLKYKNKGERHKNYFDFYFSDEEKLEELKEDIKLTLDMYKKGYFSYISV